MFNFNSVVKTFKKFVLNQRVSDKDFINDYLGNIVVAASITNKNGEEIYLDKSRASELINGKADVPIRIKASVSNKKYDQDLKENIGYFLDENIDPNSRNILREELVDLLKADPIISAETKLKIEKSEDDFWLLIYKESLKANNQVDSASVKLWERGLSSFEVIAGDIFRYSFNSKRKETTITVIPVNTSFDTHISRKYENDKYPIVSEKTLHGQWLDRMIKGGAEEDDIYASIITYLTTKGINPSHKSASNNAKSACYPIGTIAICEHKDNLFYLVAISEFDVKNNAHGTEKTIKESIKSILKEYDETGQGYDLYMPLLGTGHSRANLSHQESYNLIKNFIKENTNIIQGKISLVIKPDEFNTLDIGW